MTRNQRLPLVAAAGTAAIVALASCGTFGGEDPEDQDAGPPADAPSLANEHGGFLLTSPSEISPEGRSDAPHVVIFSDPACPACAQMEAAFHSDLDQWLTDGDITLEYRSVAFVSDYSEAAANAFACVAEESPENYFSYVGQVTAERSEVEELSEQELADRAESHEADIEQCLSDGTFDGFVDDTTQAALNEADIEGTPTVLIDGEEVPEDEFMNLDQYVTAAVSE
jgi:protein-disulfide isomerase